MPPKQRSITRLIRTATFSTSEPDMWCRCCAPDPDVSSRATATGTDGLERTERTDEWRELAACLGDYAVRERAQNAIWAALLDEAADVIVAAGVASVLMADIMRHARRTERLLITVGSPLGLESIHEHSPAFTLDQHPIGMPWLNVHDPADELTGGRGITESANFWLHNFAVNNRAIDQTPRSDQRSPHTVERYLNHACVTDVLEDLLRRKVDAPAHPLWANAERAHELSTALEEARRRAAGYSPLSHLVTLGMMTSHDYLANPPLRHNEGPGDDA